MGGAERGLEEVGGAERGWEEVGGAERGWEEVGGDWRGCGKGVIRDRRGCLLFFGSSQ